MASICVGELLQFTIVYPDSSAPTSVSLKPLNEISNTTGGYLQNKGAFDLVSNFSGLLKSRLPGGFKYFLFSPLPGEDFQFDYIIFFKWVETTNQKMFYCMFFLLPLK